MNRYKLVQLIATGGMGEVFLARSEGPRGFAKTLVIKRILRHLASEPQFVEMFLNEARLAAMLSHPNIVQIFELGEEEGTWYIAMEYIHGRTLRAIKQRLLRRGELLSPVLAARVCAHALQGLHYAHNLKDETGQPLHVVHRDISPDNVMVGFNGQVKLVDFGIAKASGAISTTRTGMVKGKYSYMAPEQLLGQGVDARTDVYAMGVLLYELLTGARPWVAPTEPALIQSILNRPPPPPRDRNPNLPPAFNALILRALEKDPAARFSSAEEMAQALEGVLTEGGHSITASQLGAFMADLFGPEAAAPPATNPSAESPAQAEARGSGAATVRLPVTGDAGEERRTEVLPTPSSTGIGREVPAIANTPPRKLRPRLLVGGLVALFVCAVGAAYFAGRVESQVVAGAPVEPVEEVVPEEVAAHVPVMPEPVPQPASPVETVEPPVEPTALVREVEPAPAPPPRVTRASQRRRSSERTVPASAPAAAPTPGQVALRISPWAEVMHDGKSLGLTPMAPVTVPSGKQTFTLRNTDLGVTRKVTVTVPAGGEVILRADLFE